MCQGVFTVLWGAWGAAPWGVLPRCPALVGPCLCQHHRLERVKAEDALGGLSWALVRFCGEVLGESLQVSHPTCSLWAVPCQGSEAELGWTRTGLREGADCSEHGMGQEDSASSPGRMGRISPLVTPVTSFRS